MLQAEETCEGPNHTAASLAGTDRTNTWDKATMLCPMKPTQNLDGSTDATLIHDPTQLPTTPIIIEFLSP